MSVNTSLFEFGYNFLGPICSEFLYKLAERDKKANEVVGFLAREGYFLKKAYDTLINKELIPTDNTTYVYASRTLLFRLSIADSYTWQWSLKGDFDGCLSDFLRSRFGFTHRQLLSVFTAQELANEIDLSTEFEKITHLFSKRLNDLTVLVEKARNTYIDYLDSVGINQQSVQLLVDVGYSGTIQKLITRLIQNSTVGLYFITTESGSHKIGDYSATMQYVYKDNVKMGGGYIMLDRSLFLESLLTAPDGQCINIEADTLNADNKFRFYFGRHVNSQKRFHELNVIHEGAIACIVDNFTNNIRFSADEIEMLYNNTVTQRHALPRATWHLFDVDDAVTGNGDVNPLQFFGL
jgi:hypothetical protein